MLAEHMDVVLYAVWQHFRRRKRWDAATQFFNTLAACHPPAAVYIAAAAAEQEVSLSNGVLGCCYGPFVTSHAET